jgi:hypothetical protein
MNRDIEISEGIFIGEEFHRLLHGECHFEDAPWALERIRRVEDRLQDGLPSSKRLTIEIPWLDVVTAFTLPGRYIYISRRLFERCADDEQVALIVGHEIAHHDLKHVDLITHWAPRLFKLPGAKLMSLAFHVLENRLYGVEKECEADRRGMDFCVMAGYDGHRCLVFYEMLEQFALDVGDMDLVFGPDDESDDELAPDASWATRAHMMTWYWRRGCLPIRDRRKMLKEHLKKIEKKS